MLELILFPGRPEERRLPLTDGVCTIGRAEECTVSVPSASVSRQHARLEVQGGRAWVTDLGSKNGTLVNGRDIRKDPESREHYLPVPISLGDKVAFGSLETEVVAVE